MQWELRHILFPKKLCHLLLTLLFLCGCWFDFLCVSYQVIIPGVIAKFLLVFFKMNKGFMLFTYQSSDIRVLLEQSFMLQLLDWLFWIKSQPSYLLPTSGRNQSQRDGAVMILTKTEQGNIPPQCQRTIVRKLTGRYKELRARKPEHKWDEGRNWSMMSPQWSWPQLTGCLRCRKFSYKYDLFVILHHFVVDYGNK